MLEDVTPMNILGGSRFVRRSTCLFIYFFFFLTLCEFISGNNTGLDLLTDSWFESVSWREGRLMLGFAGVTMCYWSGW